VSFDNWICYVNLGKGYIYTYISAVLKLFLDPL
jgi:hypothetical protein